MFEAALALPIQTRHTGRGGEEHARHALLAVLPTIGAYTQRECTVGTKERSYTQRTEEAGVTLASQQTVTSQNHILEGLRDLSPSLNPPYSSQTGWFVYLS